MMKLRLQIPRLVTSGDLFFEKGSIGVLRALEAVRALVIVSPSFWRHPEASASVTRALGKLDHQLAFAPSGEPTLDMLQPLVARASTYRPDWIIAIGGGSVMDAAKITWAFYEHPDLDLARALRPGGVPQLRGKARLAAIPTTAGTGSEVSSSAVFYDPETQSKKALVSHDLLPDIAILDPELARYTPFEVASYAGMDALAHSIEGYVSKYRNGFLGLQSELASNVLLQHLAASVESPDNLTLRSQIMQAALMAGWVQNSRIPGIGHAIAHQLGAFGIPHGLACSLMLPASIEYNSRDMSVKSAYDHLAKQIGLGSMGDLVKAIRELQIRLGLKTRLGSVSEGIIAASHQIAIGALSDPCARANPVPVTESAVHELLRSVE